MFWNVVEVCECVCVRERETAYTTATPDPNCVCDLHHSSQQRWILNPLIEAGDRTHNLMVPNRIHLLTTEPQRELLELYTINGWIHVRLNNAVFKKIAFTEFSFFRALPAACKSSQARGRIRAAAAGLLHSHSTDPRRICNLWHRLRQHWILNPLKEARDHTGILRDASWVLNLLSHNENSVFTEFDCKWCA